MADSDKSGATELKALMARVLQSEAGADFGQFMVRQVALHDLAPHADDALIAGIDESPDGGAAMAEGHLGSLSEQEREALLERAAIESGRRLHSAAVALLGAAGAAHLEVEITPEMVALAAVTELGD